MMQELQTDPRCPYRTKCSYYEKYSAICREAYHGCPTYMDSFIRNTDESGQDEDET